MRSFALACALIHSLESWLTGFHCLVRGSAFIQKFSRWGCFSMLCVRAMFCCDVLWIVTLQRKRWAEYRFLLRGCSAFIHKIQTVGGTVFHAVSAQSSVSFPQLLYCKGSVKSPSRLKQTQMMAVSHSRRWRKEKLNLPLKACYCMWKNVRKWGSNIVNKVQHAWTESMC